MPYWTTWDIDDNIKTSVGSVATAFTLCFFLAPIKTFFVIVKVGSTEAFRGESFLYTFFNCSLWVLYATYQGGLLLPFVCNLSGAALAMIYVILYAIYLPSANDDKSGDNHVQATTLATTTRRRYLLQFIITIAAMGTIGGIVNLSIFDFNVGDEKFSAFIFGLLADIFNFLMYASPLSVMGQVVATKSVKYMPFFLSFFALLTSATWVVYGIYIGDIWITIPNASGVILGTTQLILYGMYCGYDQQHQEEEGYKRIGQKGIEERRLVVDGDSADDPEIQDNITPAYPAH